MRRQRDDAVKCEYDLRIDRVLDPECAVLVEGSEPPFGPDVTGVRSIGGCPYEPEDSLLCSPVVPGWERIGSILRKRGYAPLC